MMSEGPKNDINLLLDLASRGGEEEIYRLFSVLLGSVVFVPVKRVRNQDGAADDGLLDIALVAEDEGRKMLPVFSKREFVETWAERETPSVEKEFKTLLWLIGSDTWLYLNPGQVVGKELSPWEIEKLRDGKDALAEIAADLTENENGDIEVDTSSNLFSDFKKNLISILDVHPQIEEAFMVGIREDLKDKMRPLLGLKQHGLRESQKQMIQEEVAALVEAQIEDFRGVEILDDLANKDSINWAIFHSATPFYIATAVLPQRESLAEKVFSWLGLRNSEQKLK